MKNTLKKASVLFLSLSGLATANITIDDQKIAAEASEAAYHDRNVEDSKTIRDSITDIKDKGWNYQFFYADSSEETRQFMNKVKYMKKSDQLREKLDKKKAELNLQDNNLNGAFLGTQVFVAKKENNVIISFRGTNNINNAIVDAAAFQTNFENTGTGVHAGFYHYLKDAVENDKAFAAWFEQNVNKDTQILITGHSLGAGVAVLMGAYLIEKGFSGENIKLITFAEPAPGSKEFAARYDHQLVDNYVWEANIPDPVVWSTAIAGDTFSKYLGYKIRYDHFGTMDGFYNRTASTINPHSMDNYYNQVMNY